MRDGVLDDPRAASFSRLWSDGFRLGTAVVVREASISMSEAAGPFDPNILGNFIGADDAGTGGVGCVEAGRIEDQEG